MWLKRTVLFFILLTYMSFVQTKNLYKKSELIQVQDTATVTETCKDIKCKNGGTCKTDEDGSHCDCREGSYGDLCENVVICYQLRFQYCKGLNGTCELGHRPDEAICRCNDNKEFHNTLHICKETCNDGDCKNGAKCTADNTGNKFCECRDGSHGDFCETVDACKHPKFKSCKDYDGICVLGGKSDEALCECYDDKNFDDILDVCRKVCNDDECENGANCTADERGNKFCNCREGSSGDFCGIVDACKRTKFIYCKGHNGTCVLGDKPSAAVCQCKEGKEFDGNRNECKENKCKILCGENKDVKCNGDPYGEVGVTCNCEDKSKEFDQRDKSCKEDVKCNGDPFGEGDVICTCEGQLKVFDPSDKTCKEIGKCIFKYRNNECNKLHETCNKAGKCTCEDNYVYSAEEKCVENFCAKKDACPANSHCKELGSGNVLCSCKDGYFMKRNKCVKINPCDPGMSECEQICNGNGKCSCFSGFTLDTSDNRTCNRDTYELECDTDCDPGVCIETEDGKKCVCPTMGYVLKDGVCIDKCTFNRNKVSSGTCPSGKCEPDSHYGFRCVCEVPYEQHDDGVHCKRKVMCEDRKAQDDCAKKAAKCVEDPMDEIKGYRCVCEVGFEENGICKRKCDIKKHAHACSKQNAVCSLDENYNVQCDCPPLLFREKTGDSCNNIAPNSYLGQLKILKNKYRAELPRGGVKNVTNISGMRKLNKDIKESMKYVYGNYSSLKILSCSVDNPDNLILCSIEMQFRIEREDINIIYLPSTCIPIDSDYCWVKPSLILKIGANKEIFKPTEPCSWEIASRLCGTATHCFSDSNRNFQCSCKEGFYSISSFRPVKNGDTFIEKCEDINECENPSACPNSTYCVNTYGSYSCHCKDGFKRKSPYSIPKEDGCQAICEPNPCMNDGECIQVGSYGFTCRCAKLYEGLLCNETSVIIGGVPNHNYTIICGAILVTLLIISIIVGICLRKKVKNYKARLVCVLSELRSNRIEMNRFDRNEQHNSRTDEYNDE